MTWMLCDEHDNQLCDGLSEHDYARVAQATANRLGATVYASCGPDSEPEAFEPEGSELEP